MKSLFGLCTAGWISGVMASSVFGAQPAPPEKTGLPVGSKAPAFTLKDQQNQERTLSEFLAKGPVALVFYRSADW